MFQFALGGLVYLLAFFPLETLIKFRVVPLIFFVSRRMPPGGADRWCTNQFVTVKLQRSRDQGTGVGPIRVESRDDGPIMKWHAPICGSHLWQGWRASRREANADGAFRISFAREPLINHQLRTPATTLRLPGKPSLPRAPQPTIARICRRYHRADPVASQCHWCTIRGVAYHLLGPCPVPGRKDGKPTARRSEWRRERPDAARRRGHGPAIHAPLHSLRSAAVLAIHVRHSVPARCVCSPTSSSHRRQPALFYLMPLVLPA